MYKKTRHKKQKSRLRVPFIRRLSSWLVLSTTLTLAFARTSNGNTLIWDFDGNVANGAQDGSGTWLSGVPLFYNGSADAATGASDFAQFGNAGVLGSLATVNVGTQSIAGLIFGVTSGHGYSLRGNGAGQSLTIGSGGISMNVGTQATSVGDANLSLTLGASEFWTNNSSSLLTIGGDVTNGANLLTLDATSSGGISISGMIGAGSGGITVNSSGTGAVTLSGANTYTGNTTVTAGILRATTSAQALGTGASALNLGGGTLQLSNASGTNLNFNRNTTVTADSTITSDVTSAGVGDTFTLGTLNLGVHNIVVTGGGNVTGGIAGVTFGAVTFTGAPNFNVVNPAGGGATVLTLGALNTPFTLTTGGLSKSGTGTLVLNDSTTANYTGQTTVNLGTLQFGATGTSQAPANNPLFYQFSIPSSSSGGNAASTANADALVVNSGGTLNLNGRSQTVGNFTSGGGAITNTATGPAADFQAISLVANQDFAGSINGNLNFLKSGPGAVSLHSANGYTGNTLVLGGVLALVDQGSLVSSNITVVNSVLRWDDSGAQALGNRLAANAAITLDGGTFQFVSRSGATETISAGSLSLNAGANAVRVDLGSGNPGSGTATVNFTNIAARNPGATVNFVAGSGNVGANPFVTLTSAPALTNGIVGGWATAYTPANDSITGGAGVEFATYDPSMGISQLSVAAQSTSFSAASGTPGAVVRLTSDSSVAAGGQSIAALAMSGATKANFVNGTDVLSLSSGGILSGVDDNARAIGSAAARGVLDTSGPELFIHQGANTLVINAQIGSAANHSFALVVDGLSLNNNQIVTLTDANTYSGTTYLSGVTLQLNNLTGSGNALGSGTSVVLAGGTTTSDSAPMAGTALRFLAGNQINPAATVTIRSAAEMDLNGYAQTISNLVFNSLGGSNGGNGPTVFTGSGVLTLGATTGTISAANLQDLRTIPQMFGNLVLPSTAEITIGANTDGSVTVNGVTNQQVGLAINANIANAGAVAVTKDGAGALSLGGTSTAAIALNVTGGELVLSANSNYPGTAISLANGAILDMRGQTNAQVGSITGGVGSLLKNFSTTTSATLVTGSDNASTTFAGTMTSDYIGGILNITKVGTGTWTLSGNNAGQLLGTLALSGGGNPGAVGSSSGGIYLGSPTAALGFANYAINSGGSLVLDNSTNALSGRLGSGESGSTFLGQPTVLQMQGGAFELIGNSGTAVTETINNLLIQNGGGVITLNSLGSGVSLNIVASSGNALNNQNATGTLLIQGAGSVGGSGGSLGIPFASFNTPGGQGGGADGTTTMSVRTDTIVDASATGTGTGFAVLDPTTKVVRPLAASELATSTVLSTSSASSLINVGLGATTTAAESALSGNVAINTITLSSGSGFTNYWGSTGGNFGASGLITITDTIGGILAVGGTSVTTTGVISINPLRTFNIHVTGTNTLTLNNSLINGASGLVKSDGGTLVFNVPQYYVGTSGVRGTVINGGKIQFGAGVGNNPILVNPTATTPTVLDLSLNGVGTALDLNGNSQAVGQLSSSNMLAGMGGNIVTSSGSAILTTVSNANTTFAGSIGGATGTQAISLIKEGSGTLILTGSNSYTGGTTIMGGGLVVRDGGSIASSTGEINIQYGSLTYDNSGLASSFTRLPSGATFNLAGGTLSYLAGPGANVLGFGAVNMNGGLNTISSSLWNGNSISGSSVALSLAGLNQNDPAAVVNFVSVGGLLGAPSAAVGGSNPTNGAANSQILLGSAPTLVNGIMGGWAIVNGNDFATYNATAVNRSQGVAALGTTDFAQYSSNPITVGLSTDNIVASTTAGAVTARTINSLKVSGTSTITQNSLDQLLTINTGGLLTTGMATLQGGRYTVGAAAQQNLYVFTNNVTTLQGQVVDNASGPVGVVKSGPAASQLNLGVSPIITLASTSTGSASVNTSAIGQSIPTSGLVVGEIVPVTVAGIPANAVITGIAGDGSFSINTRVTSGSSTSANTALNLPTSEVIPGLTIPNASAGTPFTVTVPSGTQLLPGSVVTIAAGTSGASFAGTATVLGLSGQTATLISTGATTRTNSGTATLLFGPIAAQTASNLTVTSGSNAFSVPANTMGLNVGQIVTVTSGTATLPANTYVTAYNQATGQVILSANAAGTTSASETLSFGALSQVSQITAVSTSSNTVAVPSIVGLYVGQPITGTGIPQGTKVASIVDGNHVTLSNTPTLSGTENLTYGINVGVIGTNVAGVSIPTSATMLNLGAAQVAGLATGMSVNGYGISPGTTIASINGNSLTLSTSTAAVAAGTTATLTFGAPLINAVNNVSVAGATTNNSTTITFATTQGLYPGMVISGLNIPAGDTIASITSGTTVTLTAPTNSNGAGAGPLALSASSQLVAFSEGYSGSTVVNQGILQIGGNNTSGPGAIVIPGNLVLNNGNATQVSNNGSIASTSNVTINGAGLLTLLGNNTLTSATFNGSGGGSQIGITGGMVVFTNGINATNNNLATTPTISSAIELAGTNLVVTTSGASPDDLAITGTIRNTMGSTPAGLIKNGSGSLVLTSGFNNFTGGVQLNGGTLIVGSDSSSTLTGNLLTSSDSGPLGIGTLTIGEGTTLLSDGTVRSLLNPVTVNGNFTFGGALLGNKLTLIGQVNLGNAMRTIGVTSPTVTALLGGAVVGSGSAGITKVGAGNLILSNPGDSWNGPTVINGGSITFGGGQMLMNSDVIVAAGTAMFVGSGGNANLVIGSLSGDSPTTGGLVSPGLAGAGTLIVGANNKSTTFAGAFTGNTNFSVTKIGTGTWTLTSGLDSLANGVGPTGTFSVAQGTVNISGAGSFMYFNYDAISGGTLSLDNSTTNVVNRLGGSTRSLNIAGGNFVFTGNASAPASETVGSFVINLGESTITLIGGAGGSTTLSGSLFGQASGASALFQGLAATAGPNLANFTGSILIAGGQGSGSNGTTNMGIRADFIGDTSSTGTGTGFVVVDSSTGFLRPLNASTELASSLPDGGNLTVNYGSFASPQTFSAGAALNSITLNSGNGIIGTGGGQAIQGDVSQLFTNAGTLNTLTVNTGGIFATTNSTLEVGALTTTGNLQYRFHVTGNAVLNIYGYLLGNSGGLTKGESGTLVLNNTAYYSGVTVLDAGTLLLNSGAANTIAVTPTASTPNLMILSLNGGSLDLNGHDQYIGTFSSLSNGTPGGVAGTITSSTAARFVSSTNSNTNFGGFITGALNFYKEGSATLTMTNLSGYSGTTNLLGGTLALQDNGALANSTAININGATLNLNNSGLFNNNTRIPANAIVNLNSGTLTLTPANYTSTNETIGSAGTGVTAATGLNTISALTPASNASLTNKLSVGNLNRAKGATVNFTSAFGSTPGSSIPGGSQIFLAELGGADATVVSASNGGILGGAYTVGDNWATYGGTQTLNVATTFNSNTVTLAAGSTSSMVVGQPVSGGNIPTGAYITSISSATRFTISQLAVGTGVASSTFADSGVTPLNAHAYTILNTAGLQASPTNPAGNYSFQVSATVQLAAGGNTINSLQIAPSGSNQTLDLNGGRLNITTGGILRSGVAFANTTISNGILTVGAPGGGGELFFELNNSAFSGPNVTVSAVIADNSGGPVSLVKSGSNTAGTLVLSGNNTYSGGTYVNSGTLQLATSGTNGTTAVAVPGDLVINTGGTVNFFSGSGQISQTSHVTINGSGTLTLLGNNTLASLAFNNSLGGSNTPQVTTGGTLTIPGANAIIAANDNLYTTPVISGTLALTNAAPVISVSGISPDDLVISAAISTATTGNVAVNGGGGIVLSGQSTFTGGLTLTGSSIIFGANSSGVVPTITSGPVGTGSLTLAAGSTVMSDGINRTIGNSITVNGNFTFGGTVSGNGLTLSGAVNLGSSSPTIAVTSPQVTSTISGAITSTSTGTAFTKAGPGTLIISNASNNLGGGGVVVAGGVLKLGSFTAIPNTSAVQVNAGAVLDLNGQVTEGIGSLSGHTATTGGMVTNGSATIATTLTIGGDNSSPTFAGIITNNTAALNLVKVGTGTQTLSGANTYTGATTINGGALVVNGSLADTASVTVNNGGTLAGTGTIASSVTINSGGTLAHGGVNSAGTITVGSLILNAGSNVDYQFGAPGSANDLTVVNGNLALNGSTLNLTALSGFGEGTYELFSYTGSLTGTTLSLGRLPTGFTAADFSIQTSIAGQVDLIVTGKGLQLQYWNGSTVAANGSVNGGPGTWDNVTTNWTNAGGTTAGNWAQSVAVFTNGGGTSNSPATITLGDNITAGELRFTAGSGAYGISVNPGDILAINGTGITNSSGIAQNFVTTVNDSGKYGSLTFANTATAGTAHITNDGASTTTGGGGNTAFNDTSTAANATITNLAGAIPGAIGGATIFSGAASAGGAAITNAGAPYYGGVGGSTTFLLNATAGSATILNQRGGWPGYDGGSTTFQGNSTAGIATIINQGEGSSSSGYAGSTAFQDSSTAGGATINNVGSGSGSSQSSGKLSFSNTATAGNATINNNGATANGGPGGSTSLSGNSSAAMATITNSGGTGYGTGGGSTLLSDNASAGSGTIVNQAGALLGAHGGFTYFSNAATAGSATITNQGGAVNFADGGYTSFKDTATAGNATITNQGLSASNASASLLSGYTQFIGNSSASSATITNQGTRVSSVWAGGNTAFSDSATAGSATITNEGATVSGGNGGVTNFQGTSTAGSATIITNGGTNGGQGGGTSFSGNADGGAARAITNGNGVFDISGLTDGGMTLGSIEGSGFYKLGGNTLTVGGNNLSTTVSGVIENGVTSIYYPPLAGSLVKTGTATLTLSGANTYTGATTINGGALVVNGSLADTASVTVNNGGTLAGTGTIASSVTINSGGTLAHGGVDSAGTITVGSLTLNAGSNVDYQLGAPGVAGGSDLTIVNGNLTLGGMLNITADAGFRAGTYDLFNYTGTVSGTLAFGTLPSGYVSSNFQIRTGAGQVDLIVINSQYWNGSTTVANGTVNGGSGSWSNVNTNWTNAGGTVNTTWQAGFAIFGGTPGTVTLGNAVSAQALIFESSGYTISGRQALTLSGSTPTISVDAGETATIAAPLTGTAGLRVTGFGTLILTNIGNTYSGSNAVTNGTLQIGTTTTAGKVPAGSAINLGSGAKLAIVYLSGNILTNGITNNTTGLGTVNINSANTVTVSGGLTETSPGQLLLTQSGSGTTILTNPGNTYSGTTTISKGTLQIGTATAAGSIGSAAVSVSSGATLSLINVHGNLLPNPISNGSGGTGLINVNSTANLALSGNLTDGSGQLVLKQSGKGTTILSGSDTYSGTTTVSAGTLQIGDGTSGNLSGTGAINVSGTASLAVDMANGSSLLKNVALTAAGTKLQAIQPGTNTLSGVISGTGLFVENSTGKTVLTNTETYTGATNVTAGTLEVDGSLSATSVVNVATGGTLAGTGTIKDRATITGNGVINFASSGNIVGTLMATGGNWNGQGSVGGVVTASSGAFNINGNLTAPAGLSVTGGTLSGTGSLAGNLSYTSRVGSTFGGSITGASKVTMNNSAATLTLSGANTYTGGTTIAAGTLGVGDGVAAGASLGTGNVTINSRATLAVKLLNGETFTNTVTNNGSVTDSTVSGTHTISSTIAGTGNFIKTGGSAVALTAANTFTGGAIVSGGALLADNTTGSATGTGAVTINSGGVLGGSGTVSGAITLNSGGTIAPSSGTPWTGGTTLHATSLMWKPGGTLALQLGPTGDELVMIGALTKSGIGNYTLDLTDAGITQSSYTLFTFASTNFTTANFTLELPAGYSGTLIETSTTLSVDLTPNASSSFVSDGTLTMGDSPARSEQISEPLHLDVSDPVTLAEASLPSPAMFNSPSTDTSAVTFVATPEPGSATLLTFGGIAILGWRRRRV